MQNITPHFGALLSKVRQARVAQALAYRDLAEADTNAGEQAPSTVILNLSITERLHKKPGLCEDEATRVEISAEWEPPFEGEPGRIEARLQLTWFDRQGVAVGRAGVNSNDGVGRFMEMVEEATRCDHKDLNDIALARLLHENSPCRDGLALGSEPIPRGYR